MRTRLGPPGREGGGGGGVRIGRDFEQVPGDLTAKDVTGLRCCFGNRIGLHSRAVSGIQGEGTPAEAAVALQLN